MRTATVQAEVTALRRISAISRARAYLRIDTGSRVAIIATAHHYLIATATLGAIERDVGMAENGFSS
jgi:hypothetical protein